MRRQFVPSKFSHRNPQVAEPYAGAVSAGAGAGAGAAAVAGSGSLQEIMLTVVIGAITGLVSEIVLDWYRDQKEERKSRRMKEQSL